LPDSMPQASTARWLLSSVFAFTALFHMVAIVSGEPGPGSSLARHAAFVAINCGVVAGLLFRPRGFVAAFGALTVQQIYSHGLDLWQAWATAGRIDWMSLAVLVVMPGTLVALVKGRL
jgi:hypothetical protein